MSKARYSRVSAKIDTGLRIKGTCGDNIEGAPESPRALVVRPIPDMPHVYVSKGRATDQQGRATDRTTRVSPRASEWTNSTMSPRRDFHSEPARMSINTRESFGSTIYGTEPRSNANNVRDEKEARRQSRAAKLAVQREVRSTTQILRRTCADLKRLQTQKQQLDSHLEKTAREQERTLLKREDILRTLQVKDRSIDESLMSRAKEEGELVERLACLRRQLDESSALLPAGGLGRDDELHKLRIENKRLRDQMRDFMKNATSLNHRTPLHPMMSPTDPTIRSLGSPRPSVDGVGARRPMLGSPGAARSLMYGQGGARASLGGPMPASFCPQRMTYGPPPRVVPNVHTPNRATRSLSPGGWRMPLTPVVDFDFRRASVPFMERFQKTNLRPPTNLTARMVGVGHITVPSMPPLPTVQLASPRDARPEATIDLRSAIRRHVSMPPPQNMPSTAQRPERHFIRGITPVVGPRSPLFAREDAKNKISLLSPNLATCRMMSNPVHGTPRRLSNAASDKPNGVQPSGPQTNVEANPPAITMKLLMPTDNAVLL
eukprot:GEMP01024807.1.p1 GENE.GEMP01024807.1~~GEMP01024807.1.p1  ORF type:complete len:547 (+),score=136.95 GEMP01024807.1:157-1797(+)